MNKDKPLLFTYQFQRKIYIFFPYFIVSLILILFYIGTSVISRQTNMKLNFDNPLVINDGWFYTDSGEIITDSSIIINEDEEISISRKLPDYINDDDNLVIWNFYTRYKIYLENDLITKDGSEIRPKFGLEEGGIWYLVPLFKKDQGKTITIQLKSTWGKRNFSLNSLLLGTKEEVVLKLINANSSCLIICILLLFLVVLLLLYVLVMFTYRVLVYNKLIMGLCGLSVVSIFYIFNESNLYQFITTNPSIRFMGSYFSVFLIPVFGCIFFREFYKTGKKLFMGIQNVYCTFLTISLFLYAFDILHVLHSIVIVYVAVFVITFAVIRSGIIDYKKTKDGLCIWAIVAVLTLVLGSIVSVTFYYLGLTTDNIKPYSYTYALFLLILFITVMRRTFNTFSMATSAEHYRALAYKDNVTGGNSRVYFEEKLREIEVTNSYFILVNLVHFKLINQIVGRRTADSILKGIYLEISNILKENEYICSLGDARFGLLINIKDESDLLKICKKIKENISNYLAEKNYSIKVVEQFSACKIENKNVTLEQLIDHSVIAVSSKFAKYIPEVDCYVYTDNCNNQLLKEKILGDYLETALANKEFHVYLQPKVSLNDDKVHAAEALVRWINPEKGMIPPDEFIPSFEQDGKIELVDLHTFTLVCQQIKTWLEESFEPPIISVNISKAAISYEGYFDRYMEIIHEYNIPGKYLEFELTESIAYNNMDILRDIIQKIHNIGSTCSMDDFGKSYSNIGALGVLPFDTAKMDKCFFDSGFPNIEKRVQLVKGAVGLLKNLNLDIVAEGIEEKEQVEVLKQIGCDEIQGYYYAKPMNVDDFVDFMKKKNNI